MSTKPLRARSPLLDLPGAVEADGLDAGVAAHYGSDLREQRALAAGQGYVDLSHRDVVTITGPDRLTWLHALTTQYFEGMRPGTSTTALLLSPTGHIEHAMYGFDDGETFWLHTEPGAAAALVEWLQKMVFMSRVEIKDVTDDYAIVWRPGAPSGESGYVVRSGADSLGGHEVFVPRGELASYVASAGQPAGVWAYEALRIEAGAPRLGLDTDERAIPNEVGWLGVGVHLEKGCYRGQETVARVHNLGRPPRRLVRLHLDGSVDHLPGHGYAVRVGDKQVGFVGSAARHHEYGPIALALIKRSVDPEAVLEVVADDQPTVTATQEILVDPEVGLHVRARL
ncbi:CAF17-like 4Fe-4S cluster assembly/insertion protein YgfZ [Kribbella voronezhensis]|uniref:CAF17-like 4Fe-4S cluster assembly/insertion protein YgfZ n=1 Tax=Kribbella voronezhensis TaxID=2512212 RepID=UPI001063454F|nr:glycine cleavage T C-terminal barrel domain-containing protein [Kribbella voronezhensis]